MDGEKRRSRGDQNRKTELGLSQAGKTATDQKPYALRRELKERSDHYQWKTDGPGVGIRSTGRVTTNDALKGDKPC